MKPGRFEYVAPTTVDGAVDALAEVGDEGKVLAGGQSLVPMLNLRLARVERLVDVNGVEELARVQRVNGHLEVGAGTRHAALEADAVASQVPLLARAAPFIGHFQIRNRGTLGGSLAHADPSAELPAVARALDAEFVIRGPKGVRTASAVDFFQGYFTTVLEPDELLTAVRFPVWPQGSGFAVREIARRHGDFAMVGAMAAVHVVDGRLARVALAMSGMGSVPVRCGEVETNLVGRDVDGLDAGDLIKSAVADLEPLMDAHATPDYRRRVGASVLSDALAEAIEEATGEAR